MASLKQRRAYSRLYEQKHVNSREMNMRPRTGYMNVTSFVGLPPISSAPAGARIIDARGVHAVALALNGRYLGLFHKEN